MIVVAYIGLIASIVLLAINLIKDLFHKNNLYLNFLGVISGMTYLLALILVVFISLKDLNYFCIAANVAYFSSVYIIDKEQNKRLKDSPKTAKYYILGYLTLAISFLPFVSYLLTLPTK